MSIITQALKKAQHEQRLQQSPQAQYGTLMPWRPKAPGQPSSRRFSGLIVAGVGLLCGVGIVTYIALSVPGSLPVAMTVPTTPQPAPEPDLPPASSSPAPRSQVLKRVQPESLPPMSPPHRTDMAIAKAVAPPPPPAPVQTARAEPEMSPAEKRARAQQQLDSGIEAYHAGAVDEAEVALQQAIALDPTLKRAFNRLGNLYYQRDAYQKALAMYQKALALDPDYIEARNNLGNTYMQLDMSDQAILELNKAILVDGESGLTYYNMACVYARTQEPEKAIHYLEQAIAREPEARQWAKTDTDFTDVRSMSAFQKLLGTSS
ncbi:tetratricopeptide repeat protein [Candidatus Entotheonella palauensis]|uniref:tetratricopeptide repeat protein n=1 Tax=Candidatus Entotheonella palauensis TaxID=93172 RepID=UPI000B7CC725|nr:tetratricopeptide repeat protein [Candidatus Entotheonella palauensis]